MEVDVALWVAVARARSAPTGRDATMNLAWNLGHTFMLSDFSLPIVSDCIIMKQMGGVEKCRIVNASPPLYHADVGKLKDMNFLVNFPKFKFPTPRLRHHHYQTITTN